MRSQPNPFQPRRTRSLPPALLAICAIGFWAVMMSAYVIALPDHLASADESERMAWSGD